MNYPTFTTQEEGNNYLNNIISENESDIRNYRITSGMNYGSDATLFGESLTLYYNNGDTRVYSYVVCED